MTASNTYSGAMPKDEKDEGVVGPVRNCGLGVVRLDLVSGRSRHGWEEIDSSRERFLEGKSI